MMQAQLLEILNYLKEEKYITAGELSEKLSVSEKTVRLRISSLRNELVQHGANILSKARHGYLLKISDRKLYQKFLLELGKDKSLEEQIPETKEERIQYLLAFLLNKEEYVKLDDLSEFLFISRQALTNALRIVESTLKRYGIRIDRKPHYGLRADGKEEDIRRLFCDFFLKREGIETGMLHRHGEMLELAQNIRIMLEKYDIYLTEMAFENFIEYIYIALKRMKRGHYLEIGQTVLPQIKVNEQAFVKELIQFLEEKNNLKFSEDEKKYMIIYLSGKRLIGNSMENDVNFIIQERTDRLAAAMLDLIEKEYHMDFRSHFDIRMSLNQHLAQFDIRMKYDISLKNPLLEEMRTAHSLAYEMAYKASAVLADYYQKPVPEDEIGYFAFIFALALEKDKQPQKSNILIVCCTGQSSSRLLKYRYEHEFSEYLDNIYVCDLSEVKQFDFRKADYLFTTVPIPFKVPVPIIEVDMFLEGNDIQKITGILKGWKIGGLEKYYTKKRFLTGIEGETKEEILRNICNVIKEQEDVKDNFYELVLERESYAQMDYGNYVTIPHPNEIASNYTFAYVTVLKKPIIWNKLPVQVILLTSVGKDDDKDRQNFYEATAKFALDGMAVKELIEKPEYENLLRLLKR